MADNLNDHLLNLELENAFKYGVEENTVILIRLDYYRKNLATDSRYKLKVVLNLLLDSNIIYVEYRRLTFRLQRYFTDNTFYFISEKVNIS